MESSVLLEKLQEKQLQALAGGGEDKIRKQHEAGKLTARKRIAGLRNWAMSMTSSIRRKPAHI
jgi:acetyl-CoA carboxylase carboxyltransferase component